MRSIWTQANLGDHIDLLTGYPFKSADYVVDGSGLRLLRGDNVMQGWIRWDEAKHWPDEQSDKFAAYLLSVGDVVIAMDRTWVKGGLKVATLTRDDLPCLLVQRVARLRGKDSLSQEFLAQIVRSPAFELMAQTAKTETAVPHISPNDIRQFRISLPPLREQRRIAEILSAWDEALLKTERLIETKICAFDHRSSALLAGRRRLGGKRAVWQSAALTEVTREATTRNGKGQLDADAVMGVNKLHGMIPMKDHVRAADLSRYKIVRPGAFAYNPMRINIGSIAQNNHGRDVLVSPDYVAFEARQDRLLPAYFEHLRRTPMWTRFVKAAGSGGVRIRIYYDDLADFNLELPPLAEQALIVELLDTGRREILLLERQRDALVKQKRGLMQKLLTGEWTVNVPESQEAAE